MVSTQAVKVLNMIKVFGKPIRVNKASQDKRSQDVGANLFIGNLDPEVDEKVIARVQLASTSWSCLLSRSDVPVTSFLLALTKIMAGFAAAL